MADKCTVFFLQNDDASRNFGQLSSDTFDCEEFKQLRVKVFFSHYGLLYPKEHSLKFRIKYESDTSIQYFSSALQITVRSNIFPTILQNAPRNLQVDTIGGSIELPPDLLPIREVHKDGCMVTPNVLVNNYPKFGAISSEHPDFGSMIPCKEFFNSKVIYTHRKGDEKVLAGTQSLVDYIPLMIFSKDVGLLQHVALTISLPFLSSKADNNYARTSKGGMLGFSVSQVSSSSEKFLYRLERWTLPKGARKTVLHVLCVYQFQNFITTTNSKINNCLQQVLC